MGIVNCKKCGRVYAQDGQDICPKCRELEDNLFRKVKEYLYEHPGADIQQVSEDTEVEVKKILRYLREGKLEIKGDSPNLLLGCERCGKPIKTGRFCEQCLNEMQKEFKGAVASKSEPKPIERGNSNEKLYIAGRHKR